MASPGMAGCGSAIRCEACAVRMEAVCRVVGADKLPRLAALAACRPVDAGAALFEQGDPAQNVYTVTEGLLKLYKLLSDGRRQVVGFLGPGDFLGLTGGPAHAFTAEAVTPVTTCSFRRSQFQQLMDEFPSLEREILSRASTDLAAAQEQMLLLGRKTARERVATFFLGMAQRTPAEGGPIDLPMGRTDIADYLGLTIETVSRTITSLRKEGLIDLPSTNELVIRRPAELQRVAGS
jgi:CRP/FNR family transcriptional regulator